MSDGNVVKMVNYCEDHKDTWSMACQGCELAARDNELSDIRARSDRWKARAKVERAKVEKRDAFLALQHAALHTVAYWLREANDDANPATHARRILDGVLQAFEERDKAQEGGS